MMLEVRAARPHRISRVEHLNDDVRGVHHLVQLAPDAFGLTLLEEGALGGVEDAVVGADEVVALARRCPNLEALCAPASASSAAADDDEGVVDEWSEALRGAAGTLRELCFQRPLTTTGLLLLVAGAAADTDGAMPALESLWAAARLVLPRKRNATDDDRDDDGSDGEDAAPPTEAEAAAAEVGVAASGGAGGVPLVGATCSEHRKKQGIQHPACPKHRKKQGIQHPACPKHSKTQGKLKL